jgi:hypothetical protein
LELVADSAGERGGDLQIETLTFDVCDAPPIADARMREVPLGLNILASDPLAMAYQKWHEIVVLEKSTRNPPC